MQKLITFTALVACLTPTTVTVVQSTPLEYNPVTTCENVVPLTHDHPAYGAVLAPTANTQYEDRTYPEDLAEEEDRMTVDSGSNSAIGGSVASEAFDNGTITFAGEHIGGENATTDTGSVLASVRRLETSSSDIGRLETYFKTSMEKNAKKLATKGNAPTMPWPSSYWPVYLDGINYQWSQNQPSPAEKYATAFGLNTQTFMASISQATGILSQSTRTSCFSNAQCTSLGDGSVCAKRAGQWQGYCIPSWFGICHAWTPAAILESEPKCAVTKNGVTFQ
uniref:CBM1 domain-containing protein n=1 Tax=Globisporangium ultimum (strain ATCC 200006 / CBS 805.95 / DAOM BR144) TaxID=431595 RepID=K3X3Q6_GLOUD